MTILKLILGSILVCFTVQLSFGQTTNDSLKVSDKPTVNINREDSKAISDKNMPVFFVKSENMTFKLESPDQKLLESLNATEIEKMEVFKDAEAIQKFGDLGKNGVIVITMQTGIKVDLPKRLRFKKDL